MAGSPQTLRRLRYAGRCARCNGGLQPGDRGYYDGVSRQVHCATCGPGATVPAASPPGTSAQRRYESLRAARTARQRAAVPVIGGLVAAVSQPQSERAWKLGAQGERRAAAALEKRTAGRGVVWLHDRGRPGTRANIDHLAIGPAGVLVVDAKNLSGPIRVEQKGLLRPRAELRVNRRDRTKLVDGVLRQVDAVRAALADRDLAGLELRGALLFVDGDLPLFGLPDVRGVVLGSSRKAAKLAARSGPLTTAQVRNVAAQLEAVFPPA